MGAGGGQGGRLFPPPPADPRSCALWLLQPLVCKKGQVLVTESSPQGVGSSSGSGSTTSVFGPFWLVHTIQLATALTGSRATPRAAFSERQTLPPPSPLCPLCTRQGQFLFLQVKKDIPALRTAFPTGKHKQWGIGSGLDFRELRRGRGAFRAQRNKHRTGHSITGDQSNHAEGLRHSRSRSTVVVWGSHGERSWVPGVKTRPFRSRWPRFTFRNQWGERPWCVRQETSVV